MSEKPIFALMYDFDRTLSPKDMQEYGFIPGLKMKPAEFWAMCDDAVSKHHMDQILAYMYVMRQSAKGRLLLTRDTLRALGKDVVLFEGVKTWFSRVNAYAEKRGMQAEHYIISSGLKEIIEGTSIAKEFKEIYAAEFCYDEHGEPCWPAMAVNFTSKTQFLYRINKGISGNADKEDVNGHMPDEQRRVPFSNMVYLGDGPTDVPCMKLVRMNGGRSIAVYQGERSDVNDLVLGRVDFVIEADYSKGGQLEKTVFAIIDRAAADCVISAMHKENIKSAQ